ncbi:MAG: molecular chaperone HtpG [Casimicrobiaceae bacterium]|nr:molecular chaperone HtpG [Casimicrobiaceae bacterium]
MSTQQHAFQAEVARLLHLVTHSLYSNKEIFLRELISNASDACDKLRFEAIENPALYEDAPTLDIRVSYDKAAHTITIEDSGIGMSLEEAIANLGTIAKSGTREFLERLSEARKSDAKEQGALIGQFGVGFYSAFIVADRVTVETRRAGLPPTQGVRWRSDGSGMFETELIERAKRGTAVILHLRDDAKEFLSAWRLKSIIGKYSEHISLPILMPKEEWDKDKNDYVRKDEWEQVNAASALWSRPKKDITEAQYIEFYKQLAHDSEPPLAWSHNKVEGATEYTQLLYIPAKAPWDLWNRDRKGGLKLYVKRVFIMDDAEQLLPLYLRFVRGVVDSADLPLNVSRELLQESRDVKAIREGCTRRVLTMLEELANASDEEGKKKYARFYREFGAVLKEGLGEDFVNRERIAKLLRFASTQSEEVAVSFADYKARMKPGQKAIYYLTADSLVAAKGSPQLEVFRKKGIEVLLMTDRVDEWALQFLHEFDGTPLQSVAKGAVDLGDLQDDAEKKAAAEAAEQVKPVIEKLKTVLADRASEVRATTRLSDSPACLVVPEGAISPQLARLLKQAGQEVPEVKPILEINPEHRLVKKLHGLIGTEGPFSDLAQVLFDQAVIAEGGLPQDPAAYLRRVQAMLVSEPAGAPN